VVGLMLFLLGRIFLLLSDLTRKTLTRGRTYNFAAVTYLQFLIKACFYPLCETVSQVHFHFRPKVNIFLFPWLELWPMTLANELDLDMVKMNHHAKYLGQKSLFELTSGHKDRHAQRTDCIVWATNNWWLIFFLGLFSHSPLRYYAACVQA